MRNFAKFCSFDTQITTFHVTNIRQHLFVATEQLFHRTNGPQKEQEINNHNHEHNNLYQLVILSKATKKFNSRHGKNERLMFDYTGPLHDFYITYTNNA